jgi:hypothetical protein
MKRPFASVGIKHADISTEVRVRFIEKFAYGGDLNCWEWLGAKTPQGYGSFRLSAYGATTAQRASYAIFIGDLAPGLTVDHLCGNPGCVNPAHLEAVTHQVNLRRGRKGACAVNARKEGCPRGHEYAIYFHKSSGRTQRYCPTCKREMGREWMRQRRDSNPARYRV